MTTSRNDRNVAHLSTHPAESGFAIKNKKSVVNSHYINRYIPKKLASVNKHGGKNKRTSITLSFLYKLALGMSSYLRICIVIAQEVPVSQSKIFKLS